MRMRVDHAADAVYLNLTDRPIKDNAEVADGTVVDYDEEGRIALTPITTRRCPRKPTRWQYPDPEELDDDGVARYGINLTTGERIKIG